MFSEKELQYLSDSDFLLTKRAITDKIITLYSDLEGILKEETKHSNLTFPPHCHTNAGRISKGDNFLGLPYTVLDYPRLFTKTSIFAYRTIFWWGNFFSNTLHVEGDAIAYLPKHVIEQHKYPLYLQTEGDSWDHSLRNAQQVPTINMSSLLSTKPTMVKISQSIPLSQITEVKTASVEFYKHLLNLPK